MRQQQQKKETAFDPEAFVCDHLIDHPDFFERHLDLLMQLKVPHPCGTSVSLVERQLEALRSSKNKLSTQLADLINIAKENNQVNQQIDQLTLALFEAKTLDDVFGILQTSLKEDFRADATALKLFTNEDNLAEKAFFYEQEDDGFNYFDSFFKVGKPSCSRLTPQQKHYLFGDEWEKIQSCALIPLENHCAKGLLAIGSYDEIRYHPGRGTTFLDHLGLLLSKAIQIHLVKEAA